MTAKKIRESLQKIDSLYQRSIKGFKAVGEKPPTREEWVIQELHLIADELEEKEKLAGPKIEHSNEEKRRARELANAYKHGKKLILRLL